MSPARGATVPGTEFTTEVYGRFGLLIPGRRLTAADIASYALQHGRRLRVAVLAGLYDHANLATARLTGQSLAGAGHAVDVIEVPEGHTPSNWRNHLSDVLVSLYAAP